MSTTDSSVLKIVNVLFWIVFIGLCIKTGTMLISFLISIYVNPMAAQNLYMGLKLEELQAYNKGLYISVASLMIALSALKTFIAYLIVKFFLKFDLSKPFKAEIPYLFLRISYISLTTGILAIIAAQYSKWILKNGVPIAIDWGGSEILFFAGIIYLLALVFKKGTDLQTENDLTV